MFNFFKKKNHIEKCLDLYKDGFRICAIFRSKESYEYYIEYAYVQYFYYIILMHNKDNVRKVVLGISHLKVEKKKEKGISLVNGIYSSPFYTETILPWLTGKPISTIPLVNFDNPDEGDFFSKLSDKEFVQTFDFR